MNLSWRAPSPPEDIELFQYVETAKDLILICHFGCDITIVSKFQEVLMPLWQVGMLHRQMLFCNWSWYLSFTLIYKTPASICE
jgi:hypothetical protein